MSYPPYQNPGQPYGSQYPVQQNYPSADGSAFPSQMPGYGPPMPQAPPPSATLGFNVGAGSPPYPTGPYPSYGQSTPHQQPYVPPYPSSPSPQAPYNQQPGYQQQPYTYAGYTPSTTTFSSAMPTYPSVTPSYPPTANLPTTYTPSTISSPGIPTLHHEGQYGGGTGYQSGPTTAYPGTTAGSSPYPANQGLGTGSGFTAGGTMGGTNNYYTSVGSSTAATTTVPMYQGTVRPAPNFSANQDAEGLRKAMRGLGCDDKAVLNILCRRSNSQRQQIRQAFKVMYGKDLIQELISELRGNFEDLIVGLLYTPEEFDARELNYAMKGLGTTETTLIEIMTTRTNAEIQSIKYAYKMLHHKDLESDLSGETSGYFRRMLVSLTVGGRDESNVVDRARAAQQARQLYEAGEKCWGTDESTFNATMVMTNPAQLQAVFDEYRQLTKHDIEQAVMSEFSGDIRDSMMAMVKIAKNRPAFFAERAYLAMKGLGTNDRDLIRVIVSRCEKDMVQIKQEYQRAYNQSLEAAIKGDTAGKYKDGLLTLIGAM